MTNWCEVEKRVERMTLVCVRKGKHQGLHRDPSGVRWKLGKSTKGYPL